MKTKLLTIKRTIPETYIPKLDFFKTEEAIKDVRDIFQRELAKELCLKRVSAPLFVKTGTGIQDDLAGTQKPVGFKLKHVEDKYVEIVHSLAKWKRYALSKYGFKHGTGLYTDMDAIRADEETSHIHSIYVDQWDWERIISKKERSLEYLKYIVRKIYIALKETEKIICKKHTELEPFLPEDIVFIHTEELEELYPKLTAKEREDKITEKHKAVFIIGIGADLKSGKPHDIRAADYDDWITETSEKTKGLNGDIMIWHPMLKHALELSSMGIRVDKESLLKQLKHHDLEHRKEMDFHKKLLEDKLPLTIGGGIGQSRLCMLLLHKVHIGEVQSSVWPEEVEKEFEDKGVILL